MGLLGMTKTGWHCLQRAISKGTSFHSVHNWKLSIWKTSHGYSINPAQILTVKVLTFDSASQSTDPPKPCTSSCSENRLMKPLNHYPVTCCLFIIACRCSLPCHDLYYHSGWKYQATWRASHGRWNTKMRYESKHLPWRAKLWLKCSDSWMETSYNRVVDETSTLEVHLVSGGKEKKKSAKSVSNHPLNWSSKDCGI